MALRLHALDVDGGSECLQRIVGEGVQGSDQLQGFRAALFEREDEVVVVDAQSDERRQLAELGEDLLGIFGTVLPLAQQQGSNELAANLQRRQAATPQPGDIAGGAQEGFEVLLGDSLRPGSLGQRLHVLGMQGNDRRLRKNDEAVRSDRTEHGGMLADAEERSRCCAHRGFHHFQGSASGVSKVAFARQDGSQFGQDLGSFQRRTAANQWIGQN